MDELDKSTEPTTGADVTGNESKLDAHQAGASKLCSKCGNPLDKGQSFCPKCGQSVGASTVEAKTKQPNKMLFAVLGGIAAIILLIVIVLLVRGTQAKSITLNKDSISVKAGESAKLMYTIDPDDTKDKTVTWESSNESIASVTDGTITGINEGDCTITVTTKNGKTDTCEITVLPAGPDFLGLFEEYCDSTWAVVGSDGSYLTIDTNPDNIDDMGIEYSDAVYAIQNVNAALGLPESLFNDMGSTTALMGRQSQEFDDVVVSWSYHPDNGLEVTYRAN
jgi:predicted nucleic acid-binding Zn ribbon protein